MSTFKKILCFCAFIKEIWNDTENFEELSIVEIEIHSGVPNVIKKSQGIKLIIKDFDTDGIPTEDLNNEEYILSEWCADSSI